MQSGGVNALMALAAAPAAGSAHAASGAAAGGADDHASGHTFSQLLGDSGKHYDDQQAGQQAAQGKLLQPSGATALTAQEVPAASTDLNAQLAQMREQVVTPQNATDILTKIDKLAQQATNPSDIQALAEIRQQLVAIQQGGDPKTVAQLLQAAPSLKDSKLSLVMLTALMAQKKQSTQSDAQEQEPSATAQLQLVPTTVFRPRRADDKTSAATSGDTKKEEGDVTADASATPATVVVIDPLAAVTVNAVPVQAPTPPTQPSISVSDNNDTQNVTPLHPRADLDSVIPPLNAPTHAPDADDLPQVALPKLAADTAATTKPDKAASFEALAAAAGALRESGKATDGVAGDKNNAALMALVNPSHTGGLSPTQLVNAAQPITIVPTHGLVNHAPVTDQVQVAVKQASKDGIERITIQLDPVDLGRVEVHMHTTADGQTQISFTVDKPETFDGLSRDARVLERSLQESGIKADTGSMQFNLRQQPQAQLNTNLGGQGQNPNAQQAYADDDAAAGTSAIGSVASIASDVINRNYLFNVREGVDISA